MSFAWGVAAAADIQSYAIVQDDATLRVQGKTNWLYGVYVVDTRPFCDSTSGHPAARRAPRWRWRLGQGFVRSATQVRYDDGSIGAFCSVAATGTPSRQIPWATWDARLWTGGSPTYRPTM